MVGHRWSYRWNKNSSIGDLIDETRTALALEGISSYPAPYPSQSKPGKDLSAEEAQGAESYLKNGIEIESSTRNKKSQIIKKAENKSLLMTAKAQIDA